MTDPDTQHLAGILNRMGASELTVTLKDILERLEAIEDEVFPAREADQTVPQRQEGRAQAPKKGESSSNPASESATQTQSQSY